MITAGVLVSVGLSLAACGTTPTAQNPAAAAPASASVAVPFTARTLGGAKVAVPASIPSVVYFFAIGCASCGPTAKVLADVQRSSPQKANYVAVDVASYEAGPDVEAFLAKYQASAMAYVIDTNAHLIDAYGVQNLGTAIVLDAAGRVVFRGVEPDAAQIRDAVAKAQAR